MRLLIIEDEDDLRTALARGLQKFGYSVDQAEDGVNGFSLAETNAYDLIILDLNLPKLDGLEVLTRIRKENWEQKILILSARDAFHQRVEGLNLGANDYLVKPFDFGELVARIQNLLRRDFIQKNPELSCGGIRLNTTTRTATGPDGATLNLTPKEFAIMEYLLMNKGRPVRAEELIEHVWSEESDPFSNAVKVHVSLLRKKLTALDCDDLLHTVRGSGYKMEDMRERK